MNVTEERAHRRHDESNSDDVNATRFCLNLVSDPHEPRNNFLKKFQMTNEKHETNPLITRNNENNPSH